MGPPRQRPELLTWVEHALGRGARVAATRLLTGGLTSLVHELTVVRNGRRRRYVLRSWAPNNEHQDWILRAVAEEAAVLTALGFTPRCWQSRRLSRQIPPPSLSPYNHATAGAHSRHAPRPL